MLIQNTLEYQTPKYSTFWFLHKSKHLILPAGTFFIQDNQIYIKFAISMGRLSSRKTIPWISPFTKYSISSTFTIRLLDIDIYLRKFHNSSVDAMGAFRSGVRGLLEPSELLVPAWKSSFDKEAGKGAIFSWCPFNLISVMECDLPWLTLGFSLFVVVIGSWVGVLASDWVTLVLLDCSRSAIW